LLRILWWRWGAAAVALAAVLFVGHGLFPSDTPPAEEVRANPPAPARLADYPELLAADPAAVAEIRKVWDKIDPSRQNRWLPRGFRALKPVHDRAGHRAALAMVRVLVEKARAPNGCKRRGQSQWDDNSQPCGTWLRAHAPRDLDPVLVRVLRDQRLHYDTRVVAVVALCRPESASRVKALAEIACDPDEDDDLRLDIVERLPRTSARLLPHLRPLLYQPFHGLDRDAAVALARAGESEAPGLLHEAVLAAVSRSVVNGELLAEAILKTTGRDPDVVPHIDHYRTFHARCQSWSGKVSREEKERQHLDANRALADAFEKWLAAHPAACATRFEKERAAYRASPQRQREKAIQSFEDILKADEKDLDLGAAAAWCERQEDTSEALRFRRLLLDRLHRLSLLLKRDIQGLEEPEAVIRAINRRLFHRCICTGPSWEGDDLASSLSVVLQDHCGNCTGHSILLLAMGERLGLPLHGVLRPRHVFVRWDDGKTRRNIETTQRGAELADADYHDWHAPNLWSITPEDLAAGRYLRNLKKKQVVAVLLNNLSGVYLNSPNLKTGDWRYRRAWECADQAIRLDPAFVPPYWTRATAANKLDKEKAAFQDAKTALRLDGHSPRAHLFAADLYHSRGRFQDALHHYERALAGKPDSPRAHFGRYRCFRALGKSLEELAPADTERPRSKKYPLLLEIILMWLVEERDPRWPDGLEKLLVHPEVHPEALCLKVARLLLKEEAGTEPDPAKALALLDRIRDDVYTPGDVKDEVRRKRSGGKPLVIPKSRVSAIQRERDQLRGRAQALLDAADKEPKRRP